MNQKSLQSLKIEDYPELMETKRRFAYLKKIYQTFLYIPKHGKLPETVFNFHITLSVLTMLACCVVFCSATLAYFSDTTTYSFQPIQTATYLLMISSSDANVTLALEESAETEEKTVYTCSGKSDHIYTFTLTAGGTATEGYCKVFIDSDMDNPYFTHQIKKGTPLNLQIKAADGTVITFMPCWGISVANTAGEKTYGGDDMIVCLGEVNLVDVQVENEDYILHIVEEGDTLVSIAARYRIIIDVICEYNRITEDTILTEGQEIKVPKNSIVDEDPEMEGSEISSVDTAEPIDPAELNVPTEINNSTKTTPSDTEEGKEQDTNEVTDAATPTQPINTEAKDAAELERPSDSTKPTEEEDILKSQSAAEEEGVLSDDTALDEL